VAQLASVPDTQRVGVLELHAGSIKAELATKLRSAQTCTALLLLVAARCQARAATARLDTLTGCLQQQPLAKDGLPAFLVYKQQLLEATMAREQVTSVHPALVAQLYAATADCLTGGRLQGHVDETLQEELREGCAAFARALVSAAAFIDSRMPSMAALLERDARGVASKLEVRSAKPIGCLSMAVSSMAALLLMKLPNQNLSLVAPCAYHTAWAWAPCLTSHQQPHDTSC
jgi:hypothetical protein